MHLRAAAGATTDACEAGLRAPSRRRCRRSSPSRAPARESLSPCLSRDARRRVVRRSSQPARPGVHPTHRLIFAQARAVRASSAVPFVYPPVQLGKRLFVDGGLVRNLAWDAFGHWGVARKSNRKRRWVPRRRRAVQKRMKSALPGEREASSASGLRERED